MTELCNTKYTKLKEALNTLCLNCGNHHMCMGTGCEPKKELQELIKEYKNLVLIKDAINDIDLENFLKSEKWDVLIDYINYGGCQ